MKNMCIMDEPLKPLYVQPGRFIQTFLYDICLLFMVNYVKSQHV